MKTDTTLRLSRVQYRQFAEQAKQVGCGLSLSSFRDLGNAWGTYNPMVNGVFVNAEKPGSAFDECSEIQLATQVDTALLRSVQRPEIDWSALEDHEVYPFIMAHEIGHRMDNYCIFDAWGIQGDEDRTKCEGWMRMVNEVLADRYAWEQIRPGEPVPLCESGKRGQEAVADALALLSKHLSRSRRQPRALPSGQYAYVPLAMLRTDSLAAYVGPRVSPVLIERTREKRRTYRRDSRSRAFA